MDTVPEAEDMVHTFCIGHHEINRLMPVTPQVVQAAHASNVRPGHYIFKDQN
jgi:protein arginine N-methyltransferase 5